MVMWRVAPPKCLYYIATQIKRSVYSNRTVSKYSTSIQLYNQLIISLVIAVHDVYI